MEEQPGGPRRDRQQGAVIDPSVAFFGERSSLPVMSTSCSRTRTRYTETLRKKDLMGNFVEFFGSGLSRLPLDGLDTMANMAS